MKQLFYILALFCSTMSFGQNRELHIKTSEDGDTSLWYKWRISLCNQIELDSIQNSKNTRHVRLWTNRQAIDVWENSSGIKFGKVTSWTYEINRSDRESPSRIFYEKTALDSIQVDKIFALIDSTNINNIPHEDSILGWSQGLDGITYIIECVSPTAYHFKTYWTPKAQGSLHEALIVQNVMDRSLEMSSADEIWNDFVFRIPFDCYINGGPLITCKIIPKRKKRELKKERRKSRQH